MYCCLGDSPFWIHVPFVRRFEVGNKPPWEIKHSGGTEGWCNVWHGVMYEYRWSMAAKCHRWPPIRCFNCPSVHRPIEWLHYNAQAAKLLAVCTCASYQLHYNVELSLLSQLQFSTAADYFALLLVNSQFWRSAKQLSGFGFVRWVQR